MRRARSWAGEPLEWSSDADRKADRASDPLKTGQRALDAGSARTRSTTPSPSSSAARMTASTSTRRCRGQTPQADHARHGDDIQFDRERLCRRVRIAASRSSHRRLSARMAPCPCRRERHCFCHPPGSGPRRPDREGTGARIPRCVRHRSQACNLPIGELTPLKGYRVMEQKVNINGFHAADPDPIAAADCGLGTGQAKASACRAAHNPRR